MVGKIPLLVIVGPTAVGKTEMSIKIAGELNGEIVSADSMQIYKYMDIGTAKVKENERKGIPHYMIDIVYPDEEFTVANYRTQSIKHIKDIHNRGKLPIVVGGTGFYINSLIYELNFARVEPNYDFRKKYLSLADKYGNNYIFDKLKKVDPKSAKKIHENDRKRVIRALEIYYETGKPRSYYDKNLRKLNDKFDLVMIGLTMERDKLYSRINKRVDVMIKEGLLDEVNMLLSMGYDKELNSMKGIGYEEIIEYFDGKLTLDAAIQLIKRNSRRFAKRQLTWFRRNNKIKWVSINNFNNLDEICEYIMDYIKNKL